jgi:hypothetical protein
MTRVQIPAYTDRWMMGDRYGEIVKVVRSAPVRAGVRAALLTARRHHPADVAHVKLDKSGKTIRVILDDCTVVS